MNGDQIKMRRAVRGLGATKKAMGELSDAIKYMEEVLDISKAIKDYTGDMDAVGYRWICTPELKAFGKSRGVLRHVPEQDQGRERGLGISKPCTHTATTTTDALFIITPFNVVMFIITKSHHKFLLTKIFVVCCCSFPNDVDIFWIWKKRVTYTTSLQTQTSTLL